MIFGTRELVETERRRADRAEARVSQLEQEVRRLTDLMIELKRDGWGHVPPPIPIEDDPIDEQIVEILKAAGFSESDPAWNHQARYVRGVLETKPDADHAELVEEIKQGDDPSLLMD